VPILIGIALLIALVLKTFLVQAFVIPSGSMENTIQVGDRVLVDKLTPWFGSHPSRGDVVVFQDPGHWLEGEPQPAPDPEGIRQVKELLSFIGLLPSSNEQDLIKRVIGVPGDTVACCDPRGRLTVNGQALNEPYVMAGNPPSMIRFSVKVPAGRLWVMGDHRSNSADSRYHMNDPGGGTVPESLVVGRAVVIAWPLPHWATLPEPSTFASLSAARADGTSVVGRANNRQGLVRLPTPAELPLVMGVVGLRRIRGRPWRGVRSGCGGRGARRTIRTRRARRAGRGIGRWRGGRCARGRGRRGGESGRVP
jgi:signal peptidase I